MLNLIQHFKGSFPLKALFLVSLAFCFYFNTLFNQYALDDDMVIGLNHFVQEGFKGIPKIAEKDIDFFNQMHTNYSVSGGRYRPFSVILFAIEHQFFGDNPFVGHLANVLFFTSGVFCLFYFLEKCLFRSVPYGGEIAFIAALLFVIHPIHTEVVANIKSSDELLSLMFILLTLIFVYKHSQTKKLKYIFLASIFLFLALFSKEYGVIMAFMIPLFLVVASKKSVLNAIKNSITYFGVIVLYFIIRINAVGLSHSKIAITDPSINPYIYATPTEKIATEIFVLGKYLLLLWFPYPLSSDYSYHQIAYHSFAQYSVWFTLVVYFVLFLWLIVLLTKKSKLSFAIMFFLLSILLVSNFLVETGTTMAERFIFHASLGFTIVLSTGIIKGIYLIPIQLRQITLMIFLILLSITCFIETVIRNAQWKNNFTLFRHDAHTAPNSYLTNGNAGAGFINFSEEPENKNKMNELTDSALYYLHRSIEFNYRYINGYLNMGLAFNNIDMPDSAKMAADYARFLNPEEHFLPTLYKLISIRYYNDGVIAGNRGDKTEAIRLIKKALKTDSSDSFIWYNLGGYYVEISRKDSARRCFFKALTIKPDYTEARHALDAMEK